MAYVHAHLRNVLVKKKQTSGASLYTRVALTLGHDVLVIFVLRSQDVMNSNAIPYVNMDVCI